MDTALLILLTSLALLAVILQVVVLLRPTGASIAPDQLAALRGDSERVERTLRAEQHAGRAELAQAFHQWQTTLHRFGSTLQGTQDKIGATLDRQLKSLQAENTAQLEKMRATVDEKLQATLETRLAQSFTQISERLEAVQRGLGEMQSLAAGVGDLKRVLTNVKTRGIFGETQLAALLAETLTPEQYATNVITVPGSNARVEFAIRLPGASGAGEVLLPIDAKFPREDFERLLDAQEHADANGEAAARQALIRRIEAEACDICDKYLDPPHTTDFAILFLATESLYAEVLRQPGLFERIQAKYKVTLAGPTTLAALLNSLRMGFRTLAIERRSSEVWQVLAAVKTEFGKFATVLEKTRKQLDAARNTIDTAGVRSRAIERKLRGVESLPVPEADTLLGGFGDGVDEFSEVDIEFS
ncbi:DNA recombination protein RmuC [Mycolicibacter arupensis]|jgi:DNA recombination protein RmuC|uniref:DNA recombination protein RmuC n=2 Tax=Mycolicibacter arupensis TaxID=342002 RepID=A0A0F5MSL1_9MYCO|nr:DNA recombination protein RmuC [Mycolicibacter arupensis]KKB97788.1 DNA recombination protein RmuC [Mycolicibacter arupensis]MCV7274322.1 DNA recombination protein RmuC [Mycolicibacter arupensis]OQZ93217.1 recombinase RmuC [Mycolicibacter arupensis]TXI56997.1 MAG: DNA recombination protein RmuC [Mycolicibacter arupensis]